jgi:hypothetical protein
MPLANRPTACTALPSIAEAGGAITPLAKYPDIVPVPVFGPRMVCTVRGANVQANWNERAPACLFDSDTLAYSV